MYISYKAHNPKEFGISSAGMISYLTKEDLEESKGNFFNHEVNGISMQDAIISIDSNKGSHSNDVSKFYMLNISPSQKELEHLKNLADEYTENLNVDESEKIKISKLYTEKLLQEYTYLTMSNYAQNFNRDKTIDDLVYYAKIEHIRTYNEKDKDVRFNKSIERKIKNDLANKKEFEKEFRRTSRGKIIKEGLEKEGLNSHIHVVVSRYEKNGTQRDKASLSPMSKGRSSKGLNNSKVGFDRDNLNKISEETFDKHFEFKRDFKDTYEEKKRVSKEENKEQINENYKKNQSNDITNQVKEYYKGMVKDLLRDNKVIDSSIPTSLKEIKWRIEQDIKKELGYEDVKNPMNQLTKDYKKIIDKTDKGIDLGY